MRNLLIFAACLLLGVLPAAAQGDSPRFAPTDCDFTIPAGTTPECGTVTVPENRSDPTSGSVQLAVAIFRSDSPAKSDAPILYLDGGPGGSTTETINYTYELLVKPYAINSDYIIFDQRGVGNSEPALDCPEYNTFMLDTLDIVTSVEQDIEGLSDSLTQCAERLSAQGVDLTAYTSAESATDVVDILHALGYQQANLYGISYGTKLALTVMRDHPEVVRSAVIDGVVPLQSTLYDAPLTFERSLNVLFERCKADAACNTAYPDLEGVFFGLMKQFDAQPLTVMATDINTYQQRETLVDGDDFAMLIFSSLYASELIPALPKSIYDIRNGDYTLLSTMLTNSLFQLGSISVGMNNAVQCNEEIPFSTPATIQATLDQTRPELRGFARRGMVDRATFSVCKAFTTQTPPAIENEPVTSSIPTLVSSGEFDPITPPSNGELAAQTLSNSTVITFPGRGHAATLGNTCGQSILRAFFQNPDQQPDTSCIGQITLGFEIGAAQTGTVVLQPFSNDTLGYSGVIPEGWAEQAILPGTYARQQSALDQTALVFQLLPGAGVDMVMPVMARQFGVDTNSVVNRAANGLEWRLLAGTLQGLSVNLALTEANGRIALIVMTSNDAEQDVLFEQVFLPVVDGFQITP